MNTSRTPEERARELLRNNWTGDLPVDPLQIAKNLNIEIRYTTKVDSDIAGVISRENAQEPVVITLNAHDGLQRQRFTVAHELGHYTKLRDEGKLEDRLGFVERRDELSSRGNDPVEIDANRFAAELLMPASVARYWSSMGMSAEAMRRNFNVSGAALDNRLKNLRISDD